MLSPKQRLQPTLVTKTIFWDKPILDINYLDDKHYLDKIGQSSLLFSLIAILLLTHVGRYVNVQKDERQNHR